MPQLRWSAVGFLLLAVAACGDSTGPSVAGNYSATTFTLSGQVQGDVIAAGGSLSIVLKADSTTTGSVMIPASLAGGQDFTADLAGSYSVKGDTVRFTEAADTFVRDIAWIRAADATLSGSGTFSGVTITVVLKPQ